MEVMTDVLVGWVQMSRYPSCFVSKAVARARSATGRLTKIVGHHELRLRRPEDEGGTGFRQRSDLFVGRFRNTQSSPIGARFAGVDPPLALGTGPGFPVNVCVGWRRLGRGRSISALILAADARPKLSLVGYGPEAELAGQRVVRLGEKSDLPIFVLLASAPSKLASGNAEGGFRWLPGHRGTPRRPALRLRGWRKNLNDLPCCPGGPIGSRSRPCSFFLEIFWTCRCSSRMARACCGSRN